MKVRAAVTLALLLTVSSFSAALGFGGQGNAWLSGSPYFGYSALISITPQWHFSIDYAFNAANLQDRRFGVYTDYWLFMSKAGDFGPEQGRVYLFCGPGIFVNFAKAAGGGIRFPIGVDYTIKRMDFYLQAAPSITVFSGDQGNWFVLYGSLGFRWWF